MAVDLAESAREQGEQHERQRIRVTGIVQGVGFRPFVFGLAERFGLAGFVGNDSAGVFIEVEGSDDAIARFKRALCQEKPPLALIDHIHSEPMSVRDDSTFVIVESEARADASTPISPDVCICDDCLDELFDPANRRYHYPFINCTNCGPRFTIIKDIPYDRPFTTMAEFEMCPDCAREYHDPHDRRFHAQPIACPVCGPKVWFETLLPHSGEKDRMRGESAIAEAQCTIHAGQIVTVKGIGGFHLACDATNDAAVRALRERKGRADKPFAIMARDLDAVRQFAYVNEDEARLLISKERPIVLLRRCASPSSPWGEGQGEGGDSDLSPLIAPGNANVGVMLPYTPLHYLLLDGLDTPLVMTSGNLSEEPICKDNAEARDRLAALADAFLMHDRAIHMWCDDSVMRAFEGHPLPIRRSRGYAPYPIKLSRAVPDTVAIGGELKATFCLTRGDFAYMSQHIGDMENLETLHAFEWAFAHFKALFRAEPQNIACDLHPGYLSSRWADRYAESNRLPLVKVQHHHAHIASLLAEQGRPFDERAIGISFDGTGYGTDGAIWGGEVLIADCRAFERAAHLRYVPLLGGDAAVKRPYRMALAHLWAAGIAWDDDLPCVTACPLAERWVLRQQLKKNVNCAPTSSMGRLFDAIAALLGVRQTVTYEAQAAIELESLCDAGESGNWELGIEGPEIDPAPLLRAIVNDLRRGVSVAAIATKVHRSIAHLIIDLSLRERARVGLNTVALSGGVFQNVFLLKLATDGLRGHGFEVLTHCRVPPNDSGLALGQAVIAAAAEADI